MKVVKPQYSYQDCLDIYKKEKAMSNDNIKNPVVCGLIIVKIAILFLAVDFVDIYLSYGKNIMLALIKEWECSTLINESQAIFLDMSVIVAMPVLVFFLSIKALNCIPNSIRKILIKLGKLKPNRLKNNDEFDELKKVYENINRLLKTPMAYLEESDYYITNYGLEVCLKERGYIERIHIYLHKYKDSICENECVNFSVLDNKLESLLEELGISDYKGVDIYE